MTRTRAATRCAGHSRESRRPAWALGAATARRRARVSLTFFEYNALAAFLIFESARLDAWVLEVGMGGRLDAVNVVDPTRRRGGEHRPRSPGISGHRPSRPSRAKRPGSFAAAFRQCSAAATCPASSKRSRRRSARRSSAWASNTTYTRRCRAAGATAARAGTCRICPRRRSWATSSIANAATAIAALEELDARLTVPARRLRAG